jgi:hypothetical protein
LFGGFKKLSPNPRPGLPDGTAEAVSLSEADIARRMPLWEALGALYLDTDTMPFVAGVLSAVRDQGFSAEELEQILRWEVRPALYANHLSVAGEWAGWEPTFLRELILEAIKNPPLFCRWPLRYLMRNWYMPEPEWALILEACGRD